MHISLSRVTFGYGRGGGPALRDFDLAVDSGRITVVLGHNGAGKSTLIRLLTGQILGYAGEYRIDGRLQNPIRGEILAHNRFGYAPDSPGLESHLTGSEMAAMIASFRGMASEAVAGSLGALREVFELGPWFDTKPCGDYSKGMAKKVSLVLALIGSPAFLVLDEPFDGLDPISVYNLKRHLLRLRAGGVGTLLASHALDAAEKIVDDVILLKSGSAVFAGPYAALRSRDLAEESLEAIYFRTYAG